MNSRGEVQLNDDPIAFAKKAAEELAPIGVRYFEYAGMKLAFEAPAPRISTATGAPTESGLSSKDEQELETLMEGDSTSDPVNDPTTFPGGRMPSYRNARRAPARQVEADEE